MSGLKHKYNVERVDGKPVGFCFVLEPERDPYARSALRHYAIAVSNEHPELTNDLMRLLGSNFRVKDGSWVNKKELGE
jgi:hypothetical protein